MTTRGDASLDLSRDARRHAVLRGTDDGDGDRRTPAQHDRDRILYSSAFRRLSGITQVTSPTELYPVHNRLIHSLKVAQVGRSLAVNLADDPAAALLLARLGGVDPDVVEAAALSHDLGHPPFGHVAEQALDDLLLEGGPAVTVPDGYNGNAQSFRIVTRLGVRYQSLAGEWLPGLNLTRATLNAILKYPWRRSGEGIRSLKWGVYAGELVEFTWCQSGAAATVPDGRSLEAALMDWADDITYAVHDVEDFFRAGLIPLDRFATDAEERNRFLRDAIEREQRDHADAAQLERAFMRSEIVVVGVPGPFQGSRMDRAALRSLTSNLIGRYVHRSVGLMPEPDGTVRIAIDPEIEAEVRILKALTRHYVIESPTLVAQRYGQRALIRSLFQTFCDAAAMDRTRTIFPRFFRDEIELASDDDRQIKRIVADLIASMSETQAIAVHQRLTGHSLGSSMESYLG